MTLEMKIARIRLNSPWPRCQIQTCRLFHLLTNPQILIGSVRKTELWRLRPLFLVNPSALREANLLKARWVSRKILKEVHRALKQLDEWIKLILKPMRLAHISRMRFKLWPTLYNRARWQVKPRCQIARSLVFQVPILLHQDRNCNHQPTWRIALLTVRPKWQCLINLLKPCKEIINKWTRYTIRSRIKIRSKFLDCSYHKRIVLVIPLKRILGMLWRWVLTKCHIPLETSLWICRGDRQCKCRTYLGVLHPEQLWVWVRRYRIRKQTTENSKERVDDILFNEFIFLYYNIF